MMNDDNTIELISLALDAALMRQTAIATNIANVNTEHYQSMSVNFEEQFTLIDNQETGHTIKPFYEPSSTFSSLDEQMAMNVQNATQYRALITGLNHKLAIMKLALQGNNSS